MRISQASAISAPPPSATPFKAAITGIGSCSSAAKVSFSRASLHPTTSWRTWGNSLMSDPVHPLVVCNFAAGREELIQGGKGGEIERRVVEGEHGHPAILQAVINEGALGHQ
jgi:hypothetical protein